MRARDGAGDTLGKCQVQKQDKNMHQLLPLLRFHKPRIKASLTYCQQVSSQVELQRKYKSRLESLTCKTRVTRSHSTNARLVETLNMVLKNVLDEVRNEILI